MSKKRFKRLVSLLITLFILATAVAAVGVNRSMAYSLRIENSYKRSFHELIDSIKKLSFSLKKCYYSNSDSYISIVCSEISREAGIANMSIAELPFNNNEIQETAKFTSVLGAFAFSLQKKVIENKPITNDDKAGIKNLMGVADGVLNKLMSLSERVTEGEITFSEFVKKTVGQDDISVEKDISDIDEQFPQFPTLVFDGPFSDHIEKKVASFIQGKKEITPNEAKEIASKAFDIPAGNFSVNETMNKVKTYTLYADDKENSVSIDITRQGGAILNYTNARKPAEGNLSKEQAIENAKKFLRKIGYGEFIHSYSTEYSNQIMINLAPIQNGVKIYPDLVKVGIALDNGSIVSVEALGFIMNHRQRSLPNLSPPSYTAANISPELSVKAIHVALIPTPGENEVLTYEYLCKSKDNKNVIVYKDVNTLEDVDLKILIEEENGTLAL